MQKLFVLAGPTASGKSGAALSLAKMMPIEIVSADSMQVYRGMDIGTAKATAAERESVPHHMLDVCEMSEEYTVSRYRQQALMAMEGIYARGKVPMLVGGTGLYINAILDGLNFATEQSDPAVRKKWEDFCDAHGVDALHEKLQEIDPLTAARLHPNNARRVVRALEVFELTGAPISERAAMEPSPYELRYAALKTEREAIIKKINIRIKQMFSEGLIEEARIVYEHGGGTARQAIGYKQIFPYIEGKITKEQAEEAVAIATRQYAKRQMTWFRRDERIHWFETDSETLLTDLQNFFYN